MYLISQSKHADTGDNVLFAPECFRSWLQKKKKRKKKLMEILGLSSHSPFSIQTPRVVLFFYSLYFVTYSFYHIAVFLCTFSHHFVTTVFFCVCHCCIIKNDEIQNKRKTKTHTFHYFLCALCDMNWTTIARNDGNACRKYARWATTSTTTSSLSIILCELLSLSYG